MEQGLPYFFDTVTTTVILGTFPSIKSRGECYYNHPKNLFWPIIAECFNNGNPLISADERYACLLKHHLGLWDVVASCEFESRSSLDSKIIPTSIIYNDFNILRQNCPKLKRIIFSSKNAEKFFKKYLRQKTLSSDLHRWLDSLEKATLPSTSPAYAGMPAAEKFQHWKDVLLDL
ncbi:MAG: DNA-deoxyinosine glycosylase [Alphaproteobacteria bacterium]